MSYLPDTTHFRLLAQIWGLKNQFAGRTERARRWFAVADRYREVES